MPYLSDAEYERIVAVSRARVEARAREQAAGHEMRRYRETRPTPQAKKARLAAQRRWGKAKADGHD